MADLQNLVREQIEASVLTKQRLLEAGTETVVRVAEAIVASYRRGNKTVWFGNGGSAADAQHLCAELVGKFYKRRAALESIALTSNTSILTCIGNDYDFSDIFARQAEALVHPGDVAIGISTSGGSLNVIRGLDEARRQGATTVALAGADTTKLACAADHLIAVPSTDTPRIQESHILIGHIICYLVERELFGAGK